GVPAGAFAQLHGWRASDGSASLHRLAAQLELAGPPWRPGPQLPKPARRLSLRLSSSSFAAVVSADLRAPDRTVTQLALGVAQVRAHTVRAQLPPGPWELEALEIDEATGLQITNGHQNGENPGAATQSSSAVRLGPLLAAGPSGRRLALVRLGARPARPGSLLPDRDATNPATAATERHASTAGAGRPGHGGGGSARWHDRAEHRRTSRRRASRRRGDALSDRGRRQRRLGGRRPGAARFGTRCPAAGPGSGRRAVDR